MRRICRHGGRYEPTTRRRSSVKREREGEKDRQTDRKRDRKRSRQRGIYVADERRSAGQLLLTLNDVPRMNLVVKKNILQHVNGGSDRPSKYSQIFPPYRTIEDVTVTRVNKTVTRQHRDRTAGTDNV